MMTRLSFGLWALLAALMVLLGAYTKGRRMGALAKSNEITLKVKKIQRKQHETATNHNPSKSHLLKRLRGSGKPF